MCVFIIFIEKYVLAFKIMKSACLPFTDVAQGRSGLLCCYSVTMFSVSQRNTDPCNVSE